MSIITFAADGGSQMQLPGDAINCAPAEIQGATVKHKQMKLC